MRMLGYEIVRLSQKMLESNRLNIKNVVKYE